MRMYLTAAEKEIGLLSFRHATGRQRTELRRWLFEVTNRIPPDSIRGDGGRFAKRP